MTDLTKLTLDEIRQIRPCDDPSWEPPGAQRVIDGQTWTLARYDLAMWLPTDDPQEAQETLASHVNERHGGVTDNFDLEAWIRAGGWATDKLIP